MELFGFFYDSFKKVWEGIEWIEVRELKFGLKLIMEFRKKLKIIGFKN